MRAALAFLTPLPVGAVAPDRRTLDWFPLAGAAIGLVVGGGWWLADEAFPPLVAAALAVALDVLVTGALHLDGLADSADGLLPHLDGPDRRRVVMAAPDVGAFGITAAALALLLRWSAFASMEPDVVLVVAVWCASRSIMAVALARGPYVGSGLGDAFAGARPWAGLAGVVAAVVLAPEVVLGVVAAAGMLVLGRRRLGGVSGDVLGAAGVVCETVALLAATASW